MHILLLLLTTVALVQGQTPSPPAASGFVGSNACKTCHADVWLNFYKNPHFKSIASGKETPERTGCEGCHGPAQKHVAAGGGAATIPHAFSRMEPKDVVEDCLGCHARDLTRSNIRRSEHTLNDVACNSCHSIHHPSTPKFLLAKKQSELCYTCHATIRAQFEMPSKHRVNEGFMQCTDCHNPHGAFAATWRMSQRPRMMEQAFGVESPCVKCHVDKRGPFVFEHPPARIEGCETCHNPHGSMNAKLLKRPVVFTLCLECHNGGGSGTRNLGVDVQTSRHNLLDPKFQMHPVPRAHTRVEQRPVFQKVTAMLTRFCLFFAALGTLSAQQVAAPTPEQVGPPRGENTGNYNITQSFEIGYRWSLVGGDLGEYRSDVNYRNGIRLLGSNFTINSKDGHGHYFDSIALNTVGLGNDPYQTATLRIEKNRLYRYDMVWRLADYYNPGLTVAGGAHLMDTIRRMQDHDLTLLPISHIQFRVGYSRNTQTGPALSTAQELDVNGSGLPVFSNVRRQWNEYRVGADIDLAGFKFTILRRWDFFKDDTPFSALGIVGAGTAADQTVLQTFQRSDPVHGRSPGWLGNLFTNRKHWAVNARIRYVTGKNSFALDESATGLGTFGSPATRRIVVSGDAERPMVAGDFNFSLFPTSRLTFVNNTSVSSLRISGPSSYSEIDTAVNLGTSLFFRYLGDRLVTNSSDLNYRAKDWIGFFAGYAYTNRLVRTIEDFSLPAFANSASNATYENRNHLNAGRIGVRVHPVKPLTISVNGEIGRAANPLTPISDGNYHTLGGRIDYRTRKLQLSTSYGQVYNVGAPMVLTEFSSHSRNYTANASLAPNNWVSIDASYMKLHLDTVSGLQFFAGIGRSQLLSGFNSFFTSNVHAANLGTRFVIGKRADLYLGYSLTKDTGDGRTASLPNFGAVTDPGVLLAAVQSFPLTYQSPLARVSFRISPKVRWNAAWQFYNYGEKFHLFAENQNFHANTGYTSILWAF